MNIISISDQERDARCLSTAHLHAAVEAVHHDGFVVLLGAVSDQSIDTLHPRMVEDAYRIAYRPDAPFNWNKGNIQQEPPPFHPYLFRDILMNDFAVAVTEAVLGPGVKNSAYTGNTALKSDERQPVHGDCGHLWKDLKVAHPAATLVVNIPLVDISPENGATEIWPGTHLDTSISAYGDIKIAHEVIEARRRIVPPFQPTLPRGAIIIRDMRMWHAGMPNHTEEPRPMIGMIHNTPWLDVGTPMRFPKACESFFADSPLKQCARFVDGEIDYISASAGFEYESANEKPSG